MAVYTAIPCTASLVARSLLRNHLTAVLQRRTTGDLRYRPAIGSKGDLIFCHQRSHFSASPAMPAILCDARSIVRDRIQPHLTASQQRAAGVLGDQSDIVSKNDLGFPPQRPRLSALPAKPTSDAVLLQVLASYIRAIKNNDVHCCYNRIEQERQIPQRLPFEVEDAEGKRIVTLRRKYQEENIEIIAGMPSIVTRQEQDSDYECDCGDWCDCDTMDTSRIPLTVRVKKGGTSPSLELICTAAMDDIIIDAVSLVQDSPNRGMLAYQGPDFNDLDENMRIAFHEYLDLRGISVSTTFFLHLYMSNKNALNRLPWLMSLKQFVEE